jgi:putative photosynthetic complex assembly protein
MDTTTPDADLSSRPDTFPRWVLLAVGTVLAGTVLSVGTVRMSGIDVRTPDAPSISSRELRFEDRADGSVAVLDPTSGDEIQRIHGEAGFIRGTLRALARERQMRGLGAQQPFELHARADGRLTLLDPATGERVDLESFGPTNAADFARLLTPPAPAAATAPR